ncbi:Amine oxidase [flavin-containing] B [Fusarium oxysporum f. sp. albedinis]|nr:Amine oxidase [flavin-containing] B [Fusarium oxysporum f. sp. albedinis]
MRLAPLGFAELALQRVLCLARLGPGLERDVSLVWCDRCAVSHFSCLVPLRKCRCLVVRVATWLKRFNLSFIKIEPRRGPDKRSKRITTLSVLATQNVWVLWGQLVTTKQVADINSMRGR